MLEDRFGWPRRLIPIVFVKLHVDCLVGVGPFVVNGFLLTDDFRRALSQPPELIECPPMEFKNKSQPVTVYRVVLD